MRGTVITKKGMRLITKLLASRGVLNFTRAAVGTGALPKGFDASSMEDLISFQMDADITRVDAEPDRGEATIFANIHSLNVESEFVVAEAGLYAEDPDDGEILYAYLPLADDPQTVYDKTSIIAKLLEIKLTVIVSDVENITAVISPDGLITREDLDGFKEEIMIIIEALRATIDVFEDNVVVISEDGNTITETYESGKRVTSVSGSLIIENTYDSNGVQIDQKIVTIDGNVISERRGTVTE